MNGVKKSLTMSIINAQSEYNIIFDSYKKSVFKRRIFSYFVTDHYNLACKDKKCCKYLNYTVFPTIWQDCLKHTIFFSF